MSVFVGWLHALAESISLQDSGGCDTKSSVDIFDKASVDPERSPGKLKGVKAAVFSSPSGFFSGVGVGTKIS